MAGYDYIKMDQYFNLSPHDYMNAFMIWRDIDRGENAQNNPGGYL